MITIALYTDEAVDEWLRKRAKEMGVTASYAATKIVIEAYERRNQKNVFERILEEEREKRATFQASLATPYSEF